jgi:hypothetical protein
MSATRAASVALVALLVASCGGDDEASGDTTATTGTEAEVPDAGLFIEIRRGGGLMMPGADFRGLPAAVVYGDGTAMAAAPMTMQFPGAATGAMSVGQLGEDDLAELLEAVEASGVLGEPRDLGQPPIADAPTTTITVVVDGEEHVVEAYALQEAGAGLTDEQVDARADLYDFTTTVEQAVTSVATGTYQPARYRVLPRLADGAMVDVTPNELAWPADAPPLAEGECTAVDAPILDPLLGQATEITRWNQGDDQFEVAIRPVLPHEPDCPPAGG